MLKKKHKPEPAPKPDPRDEQRDQATKLMIGALRRFLAHYPKGINPYLDEAHGEASKALAAAEKAGLDQL